MDPAKPISIVFCICVCVEWEFKPGVPSKIISHFMGSDFLEVRLQVLPW